MVPELLGINQLQEGTIVDSGTISYTGTTWVSPNCRKLESTTAEKLESTAAEKLESTAAGSWSPQLQYNQ